MCQRTRVPAASRPYRSPVGTLPLTRQVRFPIAGVTESIQREFEPAPTSVGQARRFVTGALDEWGLTDLGEVAELLVSEVVTNAVLHGGTAVTVVVERRGTFVNCEVIDGSNASPAVRSYDVDAATGRGLELVEALATEWGVRPEPPGKAVWFHLGAPDEASDDRDEDAGVETGIEAPAVAITLLGTPVKLLRASIQHGDALLREATLLALGGEEGTSEPSSWSIPTIDLTRLLDLVRAALDAGVGTADLEIEVPPGAADGALRRLALVDEADRLAGDGLLLSVPSLPEIGACRHWYLSEIARQSAGDAPQPWAFPDPPPRRAVADAIISPDDRRRLALVDTATVAADATNHIVFVNAAAADLLRWNVDDLLGQRLTAIIPARLRESHLAGFTRFQVMGQSRILGTSVRVPALRGDGTEIEVTLALEEWVTNGKSVFVGRFADPVA